MWDRLQVVALGVIAQTVRAEFAAVYDEATGLEGCNGHDAAAASQGQRATN